MKKSEINEVLKSLGYASMRYQSHYDDGKIVKRDGKIVKGIKLGTQGPYHSLNVGNKINGIVSKFKNLGFVVEFNEYELITLKSEKWKIAFVRQQHRTHQSIDMDNSYITYYFHVNVDKI